jgi:hypothetical protein
MILSILLKAKYLNHMPIEIRELVIKMTVDNTGHKSAEGSHKGKSSVALEEMKEDIIRECTDRILSQINSNKER